MRKLLFSSLFIAFSLTLVLVSGAFLPKNSGTLIFLLVFLLCDGYLWLSVWKSFRKKRHAIRVITTILYWLPVALMFGLLVAVLFIPFLEWSMPLRTYLQSFILLLFASKFIPITTLLLADVIRLVKFIAYRSAPLNSVRFASIPRYWPLLVTGWILGDLLFITMTAGTLFWQFDFRVRHQVIGLKELPASFDGFKIVQFSDVHLGSWGSKKQLQVAMDKINNLHPDVIFFTGDMFNYCTADGIGFNEILKTLHAPNGIYAIMGNHDYGDYIAWPSAAAKKQDFEDLKAWYADLGWKLLLNSHDFLRRNADSIAVIGVENWGATARFQRLGDIDRAQHGTETMPIQLLLSHDPSHWDSIVSKRFRNIDITFAGHTHGGQLGVDCCGLHWSPVSWIYKYWCGLYKNPDPGEAQYLYVNQGLGNIGYAGRVGILPEITLITLKTK